MVDEISIVFDCAEPDKLARFWLAALEGYDFPGSDPDGPPGSAPAGYTSWEAWADANGIPEQARHAGRTIVDTAGRRPDIFFLAVPEPKQVKNRVHIDIRASRGAPEAEKQTRQDEVASRLIAAGASLVDRMPGMTGGSHLVMRDPEGNEFCVT